MASGVKPGDYFPEHPGPARVNLMHGGPGMWGIPAKQEFHEGLTRDGHLVHLYGDGTRVVLNKSPGLDHWLFHAALDRISHGNPEAKANIIAQLAPSDPPVHGVRQILPGSRHALPGAWHV